MASLWLSTGWQTVAYLSAWVMGSNPGCINKDSVVFISDKLYLLGVQDRGLRMLGRESRTFFLTSNFPFCFSFRHPEFIGCPQHAEDRQVAGGAWPQKSSGMVPEEF